MAAWSAYIRAAEIAAPARAAKSRARTSSLSLNVRRSAVRRRMSAPAGTPCPGSGDTTTEPTGPPSPEGTAQSGSAAGSIQREGTGGKPRSASPRPGTSSGSARTVVCVTSPEGPQKVTRFPRPRAGATVTAALARCSTASRAVASIQVSTCSEASSAVEALARKAVRARSLRRASSARRRSVSSTSHHTTRSCAERAG